ncbi:aspartyl aminopeptidase [Entamoeba marina]
MDKFLDFMNQCKGSAYNAVEYIAQIFKDNGFIEIKEQEEWKLEKLGKYFLIRDDSTIFSFAIGGQYEIGNGFTIVGAHLDSPSLKLKPNPFQKSQGMNLIKCETYGGGVWQTWFDRDLSICGRVIIEDKNQLKNVPVRLTEPLYRICTCAPHLDKRYVDGFKINKETELPAVGLSEEDLMKKLEEEVKAPIIAYDLFLYDTMKANVLGTNDEFVTAQGLDNLICSYGAVHGVINAASSSNLQNNKNVLVCAVFDVEEVGSMNRHGANSVMLPSIVNRIATCFSPEIISLGSQGLSQQLQIGNSKTIVLSTDVGHAQHPNYTDKQESNHSVYMNEGLVIELNCGQHLLGDKNVLNIIDTIAKNVNVTIQRTVKKQEKGGGGSTIGPKIAAHAGYNVIDFGIPLLAMHSIREIGGVKDVDSLLRLVQETMETFSNYENELN